MQILVIPLFSTLGVQPQQVGVGIFLSLSMLAETLTLVGMYLIYIVLFYQMFMKIINFLLPPLWMAMMLAILHSNVQQYSKLWISTNHYSCNFCCYSLIKPTLWHLHSSGIWILLYLLQVNTFLLENTLNQYFEQNLTS